MPILDNVPDFDLGSNGNLPGFGLNSPLSVSSNYWRSFDGELREIAQTILLSSDDRAVDRVAAIERFEQIKAGLDDNGQQRVSDLLAEHIQSGVSASQTTNNSASQLKRITEATISTQLGLGLLKAGAGIAQVLHAVANDNKLIPPKLPPKYEKSDLLASEISKAIFRSEQGDPKQRAEFDARVAEAETIDNFRAKASGQIGQYLSNIQGNRLRKNQAQIDFEAFESSQRRADRGELQGLISQDINENRAIVEDNFRRFAIENNSYLNSKRAIQAQKNSGFSNIFAGVDQFAEALPFRIASNQSQSARARSRRVDPIDPLSPIADPQSINPRPLPVPNAVPVLLGSEGLRSNPELSDLFRDAIGSPRTGEPMTPEEFEFRNRAFDFDISSLLELTR